MSDSTDWKTRYNWVLNPAHFNNFPQKVSGTLAQCLVIGTPGISVSLLLDEFTSPEAHRAIPAIVVSGMSNATNEHLECLIKVNSMSSKTLTASACEIGSVVGMIDNIAGSSPGYRSRAAVVAFVSSQMSLIHAIRLLVALSKKLSNCSPVLLDKFPVEIKLHRHLSYVIIEDLKASPAIRTAEGIGLLKNSEKPVKCFHRKGGTSISGSISTSHTIRDEAPLSMEAEEKKKRTPGLPLPLSRESLTGDPNTLCFCLERSVDSENTCCFIGIELPKLEINSLTVCNFNISTRPNQISADWNVKMNLNSMDKHGYLNFSGIAVSINYNVLQVGLTNFMSFDINPYNSTKHFDQDFFGLSGFNDDSIISGIRGDINAGTVTFDVQFEVSVRKCLRGSWVDQLGFVLDCKKVELFFGSSDKSRAQMLNSPRKYPSSRAPAIANTIQRSNCLGPSCTLLTITAIVIGIALAFLARFLVYMAVQPYLLRSNFIPGLEIKSLTASNFNISSRPNQISVDWNVKMNLKAENEHGYLSFSNITVSIYYNVLQAGMTDVMPFDVVPPNSTKHFDVTFSGSSGLIIDSIINDIRGRIAAAGTLTIDVNFEAFVKKSYKGHWTDHLQLKFYCKKINLFFGYSDVSRAQMLNPSHKCRVAEED
ncbi:hypothetical protein POM88_008616 [Heracleum sosnowskyi]|uniref:Late embryogenesis abundant protein LEA-2 subgroup domain-containing protein n=1 Tax=Heracleum sosnowskyi TaxID=360622 RepID=A0AAD8J7I5_9APIA|nr:hypothetical protein POM88_008616 [Heracleum sosnowskyi]